MDDQKTMVVSVHAKDCVDYQCRRCGQCCRHIKDAVMVESMDAYRLANYLRGCDPNTVSYTHLTLPTILRV